ncbi:IS1634 family transposase [Streptacidiphilus albus]|uniref:IS1634 family transposase n=1 Tax=Streptacidiphilus albus TaxID=105425 RepID=UPI00054C1746|nr:IS1634 family transposase [Streptacidiphilus albus]
MYVKASSRRNKSGQTVRYLQLAHNEWDPEAGRSRTRVLYSFGREDELDRDAVKRLVAALSRLLDPAEALVATTPGDLTLTGSRPLGGTHALDGLWHRLGLGQAVRRQLEGRCLDPRVERVLFALVANRALAASSKLAATEWIADDVHVEGLDQINDEACYRAMDYLLTIEPALAKEAYFQVTDLLNLEVDLLFFDTTSTYFETEEADEPVPRDSEGRRLDPEEDPATAARETGFRTHGKSKDSRDDLPQVVVGMAVTREGIPVRVWSWPGSTGDQALIRQVRAELREWTLSRIVWVADRGFSSALNRRTLMQGGGGYIIGEKLRTDSPEVRQALARPGRYATVRDNMQVKEVNIDSDDRFVICFNPDQATRDAAIRDQLTTRLTEAIADTDKLPRPERDQLAGQLSTKPGLRRFLRQTPGGLLRVDKKKIAAEERLDGKYLLRCSDPKLSAEDIALGYKQLLEVERGWRDMQQIIDLRPVYHRREDRIRAHVVLCWLALLLIRVAETGTGQTWNRLRKELDRLHAVSYTGPAGSFRQSTELTKPQRDILTALDVTPPKKIIDLTAGR